MTSQGVMRAVVLVIGATAAACTSMGGGREGRGGGGLGPVSDAPRYINPGTLAQLDGFTHAVRVGLTLYISGEVPLDSTGALVGPGDLRAQARQAFANLAFVLRIAGALPRDVTKLNVYVVNLHPGDLAIIREAGADFLPQRDPPAGVVVGVQALPRDGMLIAVDGEAVMRGLFPDRTAQDGSRPRR